MSRGIFIVFRHLKRFRYLCCDNRLSFLLDSAGRELSPSCVYPDKLCIIHCLHSESASYHGHPYEFPDWWPPNSPDLIQLTTKSGATCLSDKSAECERFEAATDRYGSWSKWNKCVSYSFH